MTPAERFIKFLAEVFLKFNFWLLIKAFFIIGLGLYLAFAVIVIRQVGLMGKTLNGSFNSSLKFVAWIHFLASLVVFLLALVIL